MFKVEKNIPMPIRAGDRGAPTKYPFSVMEVGDSFLFPAAQKDARLSSKLSNAATSYANAHPEYRFSIRWAEGGYRVWRIPTTPKLVAAE